MAVVDQIPLTVTVANGVTTVFPFSFAILDEDDLVVSGFAINVDYSVSGVGGTSGAVTFFTAPANGTSVVMYRQTAIERAVDYQSNGDLKAVTLNADFDRLWMALQEAFSAVDTRCIRIPAGETAADLPAAAQRANTWLVFDGNGSPTVVAPQTSATIATTTPTETGGVPQLVDIWIQRERVFPEQFGAVTGTTVSYAAQLQNAMNAASSRGMPLNLRGRYYRADSGLIIPAAGIQIENGHLDLSHTSSAYTITCGGALGSPISVTAPVARFANQIPLASTAGLAAGQDLLIQSNDLWSVSGAVKKGEWIRVRSVDSPVLITTMQPVRDAYTTVPVVYAPTIVDHVIFEDVHLHGGGAGLNQSATLLQYIRDVRVFGSDGRKFASRGFYYDTCQSIEIDGGRPGEGEDATGLSYGHSIGGACNSAKARAITGDALRHVVAAGGTQGVVRGYRCDGITGLAMTDSTVDAHPAVDDAKFYDIDHTADNLTPPNNGDGIVSQARYTLIDGFKINRASRHGILIQPQCSTDKAVVQIGKGEVREHGTYGASTCWGIVVDLTTAGSAGAARVSIEDPDIESSQTLANGIVVSSGVNGAIDSGRLDGARVKTPGRALLLDATTTIGQKITHFNLSGGYFERTNQAAEVIYLAPAAAGNIDFVKMRGFHAQGGTYGVRNLSGWTTNYHFSDFSCRGYLTAATSNVTASGTVQYVTNPNT